MNFTYTDGNLSKKADGNYMLLLNIDKSQSNVMESLEKLVDDDKLKSVEIKHFRKSRSLDANAGLWIMLSIMADKLNTSKDELYLKALQDYGVFTHIVVKENMVDRIKNEWRTVIVLGEVTINGKTGIQLQCYFGSSQLDSKEFSVLLNGVIDDAKKLGIDFISSEDKARMLSEWGVK